MSLGGTEAYAELDASSVPPLVRAAVDEAVRLDFALSTRPEFGRLLAVLAGGLPPGSFVGESGTGTGVGLAWIVSAADPSVRFVSVEIDEERHAAAQRVFADCENVELLLGDAGDVYDRGPFDLLVADGGWGVAKQPGARAIDPVRVLSAGGTFVSDDWTPATTWPPMHRGEPDHGRIGLLDHEALHATEIRVSDDIAMIVARYFPPSS